MKSAHLGTYQGDRNIEEAENDPNIVLNSPEKKSEDGSDGEGSKNATYGQSKLAQLFQMMHKSQNKTDQII